VHRNGGETLVQTASASVDHFSESLIHIGREPLDQLRPDAVDEIVRRVVRESDESTQVEVAAFNSSI
jgi:FXSXX-COOH protein